MTPDDEKAIAAVHEAARKAGLGAFEVHSSQHFVGVGNGPAAYNAAALERCEAIAKDYLSHFRRIGFAPALPARRLTVVTLKDVRSYRAFSGDDEADETVGGHYDPDANWLVIFDFREGQGRANAEAKRINTFTLVHETIHLLCYNTGLQTAEGDVPACISEGLGTYGELWTPARGSSAFGAVNGPRLLALFPQSGEEVSWIPTARFLADDGPFRNPSAAQLAYAEAWVLVHYLLETPERRAKFKEYMAGMPTLGAKRGVDRVKYAESTLGSLDELDLAVRRHAQHLARRMRLRVPAGFTRGRG